MNIFGIQALLQLVSHFLFIGMAFWSLKALRLENLIKSNHIREAQLFIVFLAITIGYTCSSFFLDFIAQSKNLIFLFK